MQKLRQISRRIADARFERVRNARDMLADPRVIRPASARRERDRLQLHLHPTLRLQPIRASDAKEETRLENKSVLIQRDLIRRRSAWSGSLRVEDARDVHYAIGENELVTTAVAIAADGEQADLVLFDNGVRRGGSEGGHYPGSNRWHGLV